MARIALVSSELAPLRGWGAGTYAALNALALSRHGHEVHLFTDAPGAVERGGALFPGVTLTAIDTSTGDAALPGYDCDHLRYSLAAMRALRAAHARTPFDVIEFPDVGAEAYFTLRARDAGGEFAGAVIALRLHLCDHIIRALNEWTWENRWFATLRAMERDCLARADLLLAPSERVAAHVEASVPGAGERTRILRYPFSADLLAASTSEITHDAPTVLYTGRLEHRKGVETLVSAANVVLSRGVRARFLFIGQDTFTGPAGKWMRPHLERRIDPKYRVAFEFRAEQMSRAEIAAHLKSATVCCFPAFDDNFPFAALEALHAGCAVVTTDGNGVSEILRDGRDALIASGGDDASLADAIERALSDAPLRARLGAGAKETIARECDPRTIARAYDDLRPRETVRVTRERDDITVIVPVYNSHHYLEQTLNSVRAQSVKPTEILVVDDGSTDPETVRALDALRDVRLVRLANLGLSGARNVGVFGAKTRWVLPLDSDDLLEPAFIERALDASARNPRAAYITSFMMCFRDEDPALRSVYIPLGFERDLLPVWNCAGPCTGLIDRAAAVAVHAYDLAMDAFEDWDLWCSLARAGHSSVVVPEFLILNRIRTSSMLRTLTRRRAEMLRSMMLAKHVGLSTDPELTMRMLAGELLSDEDLDGRPDPRSIAREIVDENLRYRLADKLNEAAKKLGVHAVLKGMVGGGGNGE